jgi:hypothetical protein
MTRKSFLKVAGLGAAAMAVLPVVTLTSSSKAATRTGRLRITPVAGRKYSASFNRLSKGARFGSVDEILRRVKNRRVEFVVCADAKDFTALGAGPNPAPHRSLNPGSRRG